MDEKKREREREGEWRWKGKPFGLFLCKLLTRNPLTLPRIGHTDASHYFFLLFFPGCRMPPSRKSPPFARETRSSVVDVIVEQIHAPQLSSITANLSHSIDFENASMCNNISPPCRCALVKDNIMLTNFNQFLALLL